jgi:hypothetical protein
VGEGTTIHLYFGPDLIGSVSDTSYSDFNWYGLLHPADGMPPRIKEFIAMCKNWHTRLKAGRPHDPDEFNPWEDVHGSAEWRTAAPDGAVQRIRAPVFWPNGWICWRVARGAERTAAPDPSRESR